jgi:hypothetical protein
MKNPVNDDESEATSIDPLLALAIVIYQLIGNKEYNVATTTNIAEK